MLYAATAYALWGLFPIYFKALQGIPPTEILAHRIMWSVGFLLVVLAWRRQWAWLGALRRQPKVLAGFIASAATLTCNWLTYIWAVNDGRILEASLGYFITSLFSVAFGFLLLRERLRSGQWLAVLLAASGVAWLTWQSGHLPWVALILAGSWGLYSLLRKTAALGALEGLTLETLLLLPIALCYLIVLTATGHGTVTTAPALSQWLLAASGPITALPLLLFAAGARRMSLTLLGLMQYISPTLQLLLGIWLYHEPFDSARLTGFVLIWSALAVFSLEGLWKNWSGRSHRA
jgi:chloramphenicol-sensitive protein RarD